MGSEHPATVRVLARGDLPRLADLRFRYLAETARLEPRLKVPADARERLPAAVSVWEGQEDRVVLVAEASLGAGVATTTDAPPLVGYATGIVSVWPPVWRAQRVGEVSEAFVLPEARGHGLGRRLLQALIEGLSARRVDVLRAPVPTRNDGSVGLFRAMGFTPVLRVLEREAGPGGSD